MLEHRSNVVELPTLFSHARPVFWPYTGTLYVDIDNGAVLHFAIERMIKLAKKLDVNVISVFNDTTIKATPDSTERGLINAYFSLRRLNELRELDAE